jgi:hypothetical protein
MKDYFKTHFPLHSETFAPYADLFAMTLCLVITSMLNNLFYFYQKCFLSSFDCWH